MLIHLGVKIDPKGPFVTAPYSWADGHFARNSGAVINLPAFTIVALCTLVLIKGLKESTTFNNVNVTVKVAVVVLFIICTYPFIKTSNWKPFIPAETYDTVKHQKKYGFSGVMRGAVSVFFAYIGFDAVSTTALETINPARDMPIGILGSLALCTVLYILTCLNLTGIKHYSELATASPLTDALSEIPQLKWLKYLVDIAAVAGLSSVILVSLLAQPRIAHALASDGLLPPFLTTLHPRFQTPWVITLISGSICAIAGGLLPIEILGDITSAGTLLAFALVCLSVTVLRYTRPDLPRPFKVPLGAVLIPIVGSICCFGLIFYAGGKVFARLFIWMFVGAIIYISYGYNHSRCRINAQRKLPHNTFEMNAATAPSKK